MWPFRVPAGHVKLFDLEHMFSCASAGCVWGGGVPLCDPTKLCSAPVTASFLCVQLMGSINRIEN
jgi:hypothetical protein